MKFFDRRMKLLNISGAIAVLLLTSGHQAAKSLLR
jgi:hypothetical protein